MIVLELMTKKKMIETTFPVIDISQLAIPERSSYKPIYQISKWFARRSSAIFRAILLSACYRSSEKFMEHFYREENLSNITILDPFMGGGTTIVEGLRLGMNCIGGNSSLRKVGWSEKGKLKLKRSIPKTKKGIVKKHPRGSFPDNLPNSRGTVHIR